VMGTLGGTPGTADGNLRSSTVESGGF